VLADFLDREPQDFCVAEYKDRETMAVQWISLEHLDPRALDNFQHDKLEIIQISRHENKLKREDLAGNRFELVLYDAEKEATEQARNGLSVLSSRGVPNWFGSQCFGFRGTNQFLGWALIKKKWDWFLHELLVASDGSDDERLQAARRAASMGDWERALERFPEEMTAERNALESLDRYPENLERAVEVIPEDRRQYYLQSLQAYAFNQFLTERIERYDELVEGDVAYMHESAGCFPVMDPRDEQPRLDRFEISPTGPLYGEKFLGAAEDVGELEDDIIEELELSYGDFQRSRYPVQGRRRPLRAPITQIRVQEVEGSELELSFFLPRGSYASVVLEELLHRRLNFGSRFE
jgi:tRNA pseudouridine13 synthase